jgi:hypothetical protein
MQKLGRPKWKLTPFKLRWLMNLYPPLFFNAVRCKFVSADYRHVRVRIWKNLFNTNFHGSIYGGTILCAVDPWFGVQFWQILNHHGERTVVVVMAVEAQLKKPALTSLTLDFKLSGQDVRDCLDALHARGKFVKGFPVEAVDDRGNVCATANIVVHIRRRDPGGMPNLGY